MSGAREIAAAGGGSTGNNVLRGTRRWKIRELRRLGMCRCGKAPVRPGQRRCRECHRTAMRAIRTRHRRLTEMRLRVLGYVVEHGEQSGLPRVREVCEMAMQGIDPFEVLR